MKTYKQKLVYITGGSSGIGLAFARSLAKEGANLVLLAREEDLLQNVKDEMTPTLAAGQTLVTEVVDVCDFDSYSVSLERLSEEHGAPDLLIACAGIGNAKEFLNMSRAEADRMMQINYTGTRDTVLTLLPGMIARGQGQILMVVSMSGLMGVYGYTAYCASKFAVTGFATSLRAELVGKNIQVSMLSPPEVDTPALKGETEIPAPTRLLKDLSGRLTVEQVTSYTLDKLKRGQHLIMPGVRARLTYGFSRWAPGVFTKVVDAVARKALKNEAVT
jgi:3-dehydrosphinganine reductase